MCVKLCLITFQRLGIPQHPNLHLFSKLTFWVSPTHFFSNLLFSLKKWKVKQTIQGVLIVLFVTQARKNFTLVMAPQAGLQQCPKLCLGFECRPGFANQVSHPCYKITQVNHLTSVTLSLFIYKMEIIIIFLFCRLVHKGPSNAWYLMGIQQVIVIPVKMKLLKQSQDFLMIWTV